MTPQEWESLTVFERALLEEIQKLRRAIDRGLDEN